MSHTPMYLKPPTHELLHSVYVYSYLSSVSIDHPTNVHNPFFAWQVHLEVPSYSVIQGNDQTWKLNNV